MRKVLPGAPSWMRISSASNPPTPKKEQRRHDIHDADLLVVDRSDPGQQPFVIDWAGQGLGDSEPGYVAHFRVSM